MSKANDLVGLLKNLREGRLVDSGLFGSTIWVINQQLGGKSWAAIWELRADLLEVTDRFQFAIADRLEELLNG